MRPQQKVLTLSGRLHCRIWKYRQAVEGHTDRPRVPPNQLKAGFRYLGYDLLGSTELTEV
jgi:hypothetical protein